MLSENILLIMIYTFIAVQVVLPFWYCQSSTQMFKFQQKHFCQINYFIFS